jgi:MFS family permease
MPNLIASIYLTDTAWPQTGNNTSVSIALPAIGREFQATPSLLQWIVSAYPLSSVCSILPLLSSFFFLISRHKGYLLLGCGRLADLYGRKKAYLTGTVLLAAFALGCGFANSTCIYAIEPSLTLIPLILAGSKFWFRHILTLIILRGFQGIGVATTIPASVSFSLHSSQST